MAYAEKGESSFFTYYYVACSKNKAGLHCILPYLILLPSHGKGTVICMTDGNYRVGIASYIVSISR